MSNDEKINSNYTEENEISDSESVDKMSIQVALVMLAYGMAFGIMMLFYLLTKVTGVALFDSVAWGFNFIWCVITATLIKLLLNQIYKFKHSKKSTK